MNAEHPNPIRRLLGTSVVYSIGSVLGRVGALLLLPLYTHALSLAEYGSLELIYSASSVTSTLVGSGLSHTALRFYFDESSPDKRGRVISTAYFTSLLASAAACGLLMFAADPLGRVIVGGHGHGNLIALMLSIIVVELSTEICFSYCRVREWALLFVSLGFVKLLAQVGASIYLVAYRDLGIAGVLMGNLISAGLVWLVLSVVILRQVGVAVDFWRIGAMYRYSTPLAMRALIAVLGGNIDRILLRTFVSVEAVAIYGLGQKFAQILRFTIVEPFQLGYGPFRFAVMKRDDAREVQRRVTLIYLIGASIAALCLVAVTPTIIQNMSPEAYWGAARVASFAVIGSVAAGLAYCFETGLLIQKSTTTLLKLAVVNFATSVGLQLALIPVFGVIGATIAYGLVQASYATIVHIAANRRYPLQYLQRADLVPILGALAGLIAMFLVALWPWPHQLLAAAGVLAAFFGLLLLGHRESRRLGGLALDFVRHRGGVPM